VQDRVLGALFFVAEYAPGMLYRLAGVLGRAVWWLAPGTRSAVRMNLSRVLGERAMQRDAVGRKTVANFIRFVADLGAAQRLSPEALVARATEIEGAERYESALAMGRGLIVATAHLGSFEVGLAVTAAKSPGTHVVFATDPFPRFDRMRRRLREKLGVREARAEEGWSMWAQLRDALSRGEVVVMQADRVMPGQKGRSVSLCGQATDLPTGPVRLAQLAGAPILPVFAVRVGAKRIKLIIDEPISVEDDGDAQAEQDEALQRLAEAIGRRIRAYPDQWLMLHRVWATDQLGTERRLEQ
jgi:KDO2-lipid IV(A) lauroyltransferase